MKYLFIVQGEGRGHLTQAMTLEKLLTGRGHEVVEVMVGRSPQRTLPEFFLRGINSPVVQFDSMNFMPSASNRKPDMFRTIVFNAFRLYRFFPSMRQIRDAVQESGADVVVNFYELMAGLTYAFYDMKVPMVCIGHQYLFLHRDFSLPKRKYPGSLALALFSRITAYGATKLLALSFNEMTKDDRRKIVVVPPLLRREVLVLNPQKGDYIHGYMLNSGFAAEVCEWHKAHPEIPLRFFWDNRDKGRIYEVDETLTYYLIDDKEFLCQMKGCMAYASTAGFESVCEAMYLGKPILMVPSHIEQEINAFDAVRAGAGVSSETFDLDLLLDFAKDFRPVAGFREWVADAADMIVVELENVK